MSAQRTDNWFICRGAKRPRNAPKDATLLTPAEESENGNFYLKLFNFTKALGAGISPRLRDLIDIASLVYIADRKTGRGSEEAVVYEAWSRSMRFVIPVRDLAFWKEASVTNALCKLLEFCTGDRSYKFTFVKLAGDAEPNWLDDLEAPAPLGKKPKVMLFSGGLDSLAGALSLAAHDGPVLLCTHRSSRPVTKKVQDGLVKKLQEAYPGRFSHCPFTCNLRNVEGKADEETQRTRSLLYGAVAFVAARVYRSDELLVYENGVTSLNFPRRGDQLNARASRTTHPKTLRLMEDLFRVVGDCPHFIVKNPFSLTTKAEVVKIIVDAQRHGWISQSISCGTRSMATDARPNCGTCFQCTDRRLAVFSNGIGMIDASFRVGLTDPIPLRDRQQRTSFIDFIRQALDFKKITSGVLMSRYADNLSDVVAASRELGGETEIVRDIHSMLNRHGESADDGLKKMKLSGDSEASPPDTSLLYIIEQRAYTLDDHQRCAADLICRIQRALPQAFKSGLPEHENRVNDEIAAILAAVGADFHREYPTDMVALARSIPDFASRNGKLLIEAKYLRKNGQKSAVNEQILADYHQYPQDAFLLVVVYDPHRRILDDSAWSTDLESRRPRTIVRVIR